MYIKNKFNKKVVVGHPNATPVTINNNITYNQTFNQCNNVINNSSNNYPNIDEVTDE